MTNWQYLVGPERRRIWYAYWLFGSLFSVPLFALLSTLWSPISWLMFGSVVSMGLALWKLVVFDMKRDEVRMKREMARLDSAVRFEGMYIEPCPDWDEWADPPKKERNPLLDNPLED